MPISICSPKNMGKKLPNELKRYFFAFLQITPMQNFSGGIRGCHMKADVL